MFLRIFYTILFVNLVIISCFQQANGLDKEKSEIYEKEKFVFKPIVGNGRHEVSEENILKNEIQEINKNIKELFFKLVACIQNQTKCKEFDELTTQIESNFVKGDRLPVKDKEYMHLQHLYSQFKLPQKQNNFYADGHLFKPKKLRELTQEEKKVPFEERFGKKYIGKIPEVVDDMIFYLQNYEEYSKTQLKVPHQILLHGSPGPGKSHLIEMIAEELEIPILAINAGVFNDKYCGVSTRCIQKFFENLEKQKELIIVFIDDIDILTGKQSKESEVLLAELENIKNNKKVFIFCATDDLERIDSHFKRKFVTTHVMRVPLAAIKFFEKNKDAQGPIWY